MRAPGRLAPLRQRATGQRLRGADGSCNGHGRRPRNGVSLVATLEAVLAGGKPMRVGDIVEAVLVQLWLFGRRDWGSGNALCYLLLADGIPPRLKGW